MIAQPLEQSGRELAKDRRNGSAGRANDNGCSINGAHAACFGELFGCKSPIAPLQALDNFEPRG